MRLEQVVYIDVLFGINFVANFLILWATDQLLRLHTKGRWLALGALGGALYAVLIFFPRLSFAYSAAAKMLFSLGLVALTYRIRGSRLFFKTLAVFYTVSVFLGGALVAFFYVSGIGSKTGAVVRNGSLYFEMPWRPVMLGFLAGYPAVWIVCRLLRRKKEEHLYPIRLTQGQKTVNLMGILDTGNHLKEPFSGNAVLVAEYERVRDILPSEFCLCFEKKRSEGREETSDWEEVFSAASGLRLRAIPFHSVGRENGMLVGFCPDRVSVEENEREIALSKVVVGLYAGQLSKDNRYGALLSPEMMK
jgi:stage II sporulation protein GA (sporulation sigma-E factor processing peptidase)